jgi:uncharacterized protein
MTDNAQTIADLYAAFGRGDIPSILSKLSDQVAWEVESGTSTQAAGVPWFKPGRGKANAQEFFRVLSAMQFNAFTADGIHASGNRVFAEVTFSITVPGGHTFQDSVIHAWTLDKAGLVSEYRNYVDTAKHIAAAAAWAKSKAA